MKYLLPGCVLLFSTWTVHAQFGGLIKLTPTNPVSAAGLGLLKGRLQSPGEFVTTIDYHHEALTQKRTPEGGLPLLARGQVVALEQQLAACYQVLLASPTEPLLVGDRSDQAFQAAIHHLTSVNTNWNTAGYLDEIAFYRQQDRVRTSRRLELSAARSTRQRDSVHLATRQRSAPDPLLSASPTTAYVNAQSQVELLTEPNEFGTRLGQVVPGSLLSVFYTSPRGACYVRVDEVYGWLSKSALAPTLDQADDLREDYSVETHTKVKPGYVALLRAQEPVPETVLPSALPAVAKARVMAAAEKEAADAAAAAAYAKAHPDPKKLPVKNNTVYFNLDERPMVTQSSVYVRYHLRPTCPALKGERVTKANYNDLVLMQGSVAWECCPECGYYYPPAASSPTPTHAKPVSTPATHQVHK